MSFDFQAAGKSASMKVCYVTEKAVEKTAYAPGYVLGRTAHLRPIGYVAGLALRGANSFIEGMASGKNAHQAEMDERIENLAKKHAEIDAEFNKEVCVRFFSKWNASPAS